jgi:hypothetical protein
MSLTDHITLLNIYKIHCPHSPAMMNTVQLSASSSKVIGLVESINARMNRALPSCTAFSPTCSFPSSSTVSCTNALQMALTALMSWRTDLPSGVSVSASFQRGLVNLRLMPWRAWSNGCATMARNRSESTWPGFQPWPYMCWCTEGHGALTSNATLPNTARVSSAAKAQKSSTLSSAAAWSNANIRCRSCGSRMLATFSMVDWLAKTWPAWR